MIREQCDDKHLVKRQARSDTSLKIHFGSIASGNKGVKDGAERDNIAKIRGVICCEMEVARLRDKFPCIVIRGRTDFTDSPKNKRWQPYAVALQLYLQENL